MQFNPVNAILIIGYCVTFYHLEADYPVSSFSSFTSSRMSKSFYLLILQVLFSAFLLFISCDLRSRKKSLASTVVCCWQQFQRQDKCIDCLFVFSGNVNVQDKCASAVAG